MIASKVLAYSQGLLKSVDSEESFREFVKSEADRVLEEGDMVLTMKNKVLIPNAGIDRSNVPEGKAVLWPTEPFESAEKIRKKLMSEFSLEKLGIVISDSFCQPLRKGTAGVAIGWAGFEGVQDERGAKDLHGRDMVYTRIAVADSLSSAANLLMGESDASIPFVVVRDFDARFTDDTYSKEDYYMQPSDCIYRSIYNSRIT